MYWAWWSHQGTIKDNGRHASCKWSHGLHYTIDYSLIHCVTLSSYNINSAKTTPASIFPIPCRMLQRTPLEGMNSMSSNSKDSKKSADFWILSTFGPAHPAQTETRHLSWGSVSTLHGFPKTSVARGKHERIWNYGLKWLNIEYWIIIDRKRVRNVQCKTRSDKWFKMGWIWRKWIRPKTHPKYPKVKVKKTRAPRRGLLSKGLSSLPVAYIRCGGATETKSRTM